MGAAGQRAMGFQAPIAAHHFLLARLGEAWKMSFEPEDIVIERQDQTAVFWNDIGSVTIEQSSVFDESSLVVISRSNLTALWMRLKAMDEQGPPL